MREKAAQFVDGALLLTVLVPLQMVLGDLHGLNTREYQPAKLAAIEARWDTAATTERIIPRRRFSDPWILNSQLGFHSYWLTRASVATRVQRTRFQDRWAVFWPGNMEPPPRVALAA
jgi:hypothetical protein